MLFSDQSFIELGVEENRTSPIQMTFPDQSFIEFGVEEKGTSPIYGTLNFSCIGSNVKLITSFLAILPPVIYSQPGP